MENFPLEERVEFPQLGSRARQWRRFEDGFTAWLSSPEGRFSTWCAQRRLDDSAPLLLPH